MKPKPKPAPKKPALPPRALFRMSDVDENDLRLAGTIFVNAGKLRGVLLPKGKRG